MEKTCTKCGQLKELELFVRDKNLKSGYAAKCRACDSKISGERQKKNLEKVLEKNRKWRAANPSKVRGYKEKSNPSQRIKRKEKYNTDNIYREKVINRVKSYRNNPKNKPIIRAAKKRLAHKYRQSPEYRAIMNLRRRLSFLLCGKRSDAHSLELIGCNKNELKIHLELQFTEGMCWDNYGINGWHIDHIIPCASFDLSKKEDQRKCFHYSNLQPLWAKDNLRKGDSVSACI
jgi:hypothetical protein